MPEIHLVHAQAASKFATMPTGDLQAANMPVTRNAEGDGSLAGDLLQRVAAQAFLVVLVCSPDALGLLERYPLAAPDGPKSLTLARARPCKNGFWGLPSC